MRSSLPTNWTYACLPCLTLRSSVISVVSVVLAIIFLNPLVQGSYLAGFVRNSHDAHAPDCFFHVVVDPIGLHAQLPTSVIRSRRPVHWLAVRVFASWLMGQTRPDGVLDTVERPAIPP